MPIVAVCILNLFQTLGCNLPSYKLKKNERNGKIKYGVRI